MEHRKTQSPKEHHEPRKTIYKWCFFCCHLFLSENWVPQNLIFNVHHISPLNLSKININCIQLRGIIFRHAQTSCCWFCVPLKPVISPPKCYRAAVLLVKTWNLIFWGYQRVPRYPCADARWPEVLLALEVPETREPLRSKCCCCFSLV